MTRGEQRITGERTQKLKSQGSDALLWIGPATLATQLRLAPQGAFPISVDDGPDARRLDVTATTLQELPDYLANRPLPAAAFSPLFWSGGDATDVARILAAAQFLGPYRALSAEGPDPKAIQREIRGAFPGIDFGLLILPGDMEAPVASRPDA